MLSDSFYFSVKFYELFSEIEQHLDWELWLLRGFVAVPQGLEDDENGGKSTRMDVFQMISSHIGEASPVDFLGSLGR